MPQSPTNGIVSHGSQLTGVGASTLLNVSGTVVVKASAGRVAKVIILGTVGTGGTLTLNDCTTVGAATAANQIFTTVGTVAVGTIISLDFPFMSGLVISAVPTGGTVLLAVSYT